LTQAAVQTFPQKPQLFLSLWRSVHELPQQVAEPEPHAAWADGIAASLAIAWPRDASGARPWTLSRGR
jgi:hypothetical protein